MKPDGTAEFSCLLCKADSFSMEIEAATDHFLGYPGHFDYVRCGKCGMVQQYPVPEDTGRFYRDYPVHQNRSAFYRFARRLLMPGLYFRTQSPQGLKLLDFGCGSGDFLSEMKRSGAEAIGYEFDAKVADRTGKATGVRIYSDTDSLVRDCAGTLDVVTMHCVMEHLTTPRETLALAAKLLRAGGTLYVVLPRFDSWDRRLFGRYWHSLDPPRHILFPDEAHFRALGKPCGLELERVAEVCFPNNLSASLSAAMFGKAYPLLFLPLSPIGALFHWFRPTGTRAFTLRRISE